MLRILVADDHDTIRQIVKTILLDEFPAAHIEEAVDTQMLIDFAIQKDWDLIVSDFVMPGGGALVALEKIKQSKPALPVIIISTHPAEQYAKLVIAAGAQEFINKVSLPDSLITTVKRILDSAPRK